MKAVVMAGGEGTRLRPLTSTCPKPMIKLAGKPVLEYIIDLLVKNGADDIVVTCKYRAEDIENYVSSVNHSGVKISCITEKNVLGTAGSVKNAARDWNEPFVVISGDCMCDIDLSKVMLYHDSIHADATIVCIEVEDPREYGTVRLHDNGSVDGFCEKPDWSHAASDLANTGIYIINPDVLKLIPDNVQYDFAAHLFPDMLTSGKKLYGYQAAGYWCDIGDLKSLRMCAKDILSSRIDLGGEKNESGVLSPYGKPDGDYEISPPVYIGKNVVIGKNSVIGPFTVIEDNVHIDENTRIKKSIVYSNGDIGAGCDLIGSIVGARSVIKDNVVCLEGSCMGDGCTVQSGTTISNNVLVWPEKTVPYRSVLTENLRDGRSEYELIGDNGISGITFAEMSCEKCCRLGEALASSSCGEKIGIGYDNTKSAKTIAMATLAGMISAGGKISDYGECFESQLRFFVSFSSLRCGIYITADAKNTYIKLFGEYGLPLYRSDEREIESRYKRSDFRRCSSAECSEINDMSSVAELYEGRILSYVGDDLEDIEASIMSVNPMIKETAEKCLYLMGGNVGKYPQFTIDNYGRSAAAIDEKGNSVSYDKLLILNAIDSFKNNFNICVPFDSPSCLEKIAKDYDKNVSRVGQSPMMKYSNNIALSVRKSMWAYDALFLVFNTLGMMHKTKKTLSSLVSEIPEYYAARKVIASSVSPSKIAEILGVKIDSSSQGIRAENRSGYVTVSASAGGRLVKIIAEAENMEAAEEICVDTENKIRRSSLDIYHQ